MRVLRKYIKAIIFFLLVVLFLGVSLLVDLIIRSKKRKLGYFSKIASFFARLTLIALGVRIEARNLNRLNDKKESYLIISNHLSYLDSFVISTVVPSVFIANSELKDQFPLGAITKYSGAVFVERRNRGSLLEDIKNMKVILNMGLDVVLFPEGTTSDGEGVMKFRTPLLMSAMESNVNILPICIRYRKINGSDVTASNKDLVFFYGDIGFFDHLFRLLELESIVVELIELECLETLTHGSRKEAAEVAHGRISDAYHGGEARI